MSPFLNFVMLKGSDPSTATMALFTANGDSLDKSLSLSASFSNINWDHIQVWVESKFVVMKMGSSNPSSISHLGILWSHNFYAVDFHCQCSPPTLRAQQGDIIIVWSCALHTDIRDKLAMYSKNTKVNLDWPVEQLPSRYSKQKPLPNTSRIQQWRTTA